MITRQSPSAGQGGASDRWVTSASLISRSACWWLRSRASNRSLRTASTCPGAEASSFARPSGVSSANDPRRSSAQARLRTQPAASRRATAWDSRLRDDSDESASWLIRSVRSGASERRTRIS